MKDWIIELIFPLRRYFHHIDWGTNGDYSVRVDGYHDKKGIAHITKVTAFDKEGNEVK